MKKIIPYDYWINSQLSIARHYGGISYNWTQYVVDWIFAKEEDWLCKPDLIEEKLYNQMKKERPQEVKEYYEKAKKLELTKLANAKD
jgi:hypothetical protein